MSVDDQIQLHLHPVAAQTKEEHELHTKGFTLAGTVPLPNPEDLKTTEPFQHIFNCRDSELVRTRKRPRSVRQYRSDGKRSQARVVANTRSWRLFIRQLTKTIQLSLPHHAVGKTLQFTDAVVIQSAKNCQQQAAHTDHVPSLSLQRLIHDHPYQLPLAVLVAVQHGTTLEVWPGSIGLSVRSSDSQLPTTKIPHQTLAIPTGSVVVFRPDLIHAGSAYGKKHQRLHLFLDSQAFAREADTTFMIYDEDLKLAKWLSP